MGVRRLERKYSSSKVAPTLQESITLTAGEDWALGDAVKIMDANTCADKYFEIIAVNIEWAEPDDAELPGDFLPK